MNVCLYPWGSDEHLSLYRRVIEYHWYEVLGHHQIRLNWLTDEEWDGGYHKIPQDHFDLFIYDTMFTEYYRSQGWLCPLDREEITYADEINSRLLSLICHEGKYYGIPIYGCIYVLFYRSNDTELASIQTFEELLEIASKRHFVMRKPSRTVKTLNYLTLHDRHRGCDSTNDENLNQHIIQRLSHFYKYSKYLLDKTDQYSFDQSSFYIGFTEDLNTMLLVNDTDLSQIDLMFVPLNNHDRPQCWLDCIGIHPETKRRGTYSKSMELANLMTSSTVMNECLKGQLYVLPSNQVTLRRLASNDAIFAKLHRLMESTLFRPSSSLPVQKNNSISIQDQWRQIMTRIISQHQQDMQRIVRSNSMTN